MQAIILAGGLGTRLRGVVHDVPKPMAPVCDKPFLEYILEELNNNGFKKVVLAVGYKHEVIMDHFHNKYKNIEILYSIEDSPLGTGGCIKKALNLLDDEYVYIVNGDTMFRIDYSKMKTSKDVMIACKYLDKFDRYGKVIIDNDRIVSFKEKEPNQSGYFNGGIYLFKRNILNNFDLGEKFSLEKDFFEKYIDNIYIEAYKSSDYFIDIGIPEDYFKAEEDFK